MAQSNEKHQIYNESLALFTDLYELTMAYGYWKTGKIHCDAVFHLTFRKWPFRGGYAIAAGLGSLIEFIQNFHFTKSDIEYLRSLKDSANQPLFEEGFLVYLQNLTFTCDVDALEEGTPVFPYEPLIRVKGPILEAQILESAILNILNFQTLIATKASRITLAAENDIVVEFGMRRAQGIDGAISASRASFIGGCQSTSHVLAGKLFGIPVRGTMAHSWIMAFDDEKEAFESFAKVMPHNCVFLIDTYDSLEGASHAIQVAKSLQPEDFTLLGVRLDSGDLAHLSIEVRKILDKEGFSSARIMASNELDEHLIRDLKSQGAKITIWGVGTNLVTAKDQPALDGVYKLSSVQNDQKEWVDRIKISEQTAKVTVPGHLQIRRYYKNEKYIADVIFDERSAPLGRVHIVGIPDENHQIVIDEATSYQDLLVPIFRKGKQIYSSPSLRDMQKKCKQQLSFLDFRMKRFINPHPYFVGLERSLHQKRKSLMESSL